MPEDDEVALTILHTADWHLGMKFAQFDRDDQPHLTRARLTAVERILGLAEQWDVDAVLCAGDLFDDPHPEKEWYEGLATKLMECDRKWGRKRPVFLLPGNHDPVTATSVWGPDHPFRRMIPSFVYIIDQDRYTYDLADDAVLVANPCRSQAGEDDLAMKLPAREDGDDRIRVGMVHGQTFDIPGHQSNFPISKGASTDRGLDYLAIGDTHSYRNVTPGSIPTVYPGSPEWTNFPKASSDNQGHALIVYFRRQGRKPKIQVEDVGTWIWKQTTCRSLVELRDLKHDPNLKRTVLKLELDMKIPLKEYEEAELLLTKLRGSSSVAPLAGPCLIDRSGLRLDTSDIDDFPDDMPDVLKTVLNKLSSVEPEERELADRAIFHLFRIVKQGIPETEAP